MCYEFLKSVSEKSLMLAVFIHNKMGGVWFVGEPEYQGALKAEGYEKLLGAIIALSSEKGRNSQRELQEKNFPLPDTWDTAPRMVEFLTNAWITR